MADEVTNEVATPVVAKAQSTMFGRTYNDIGDTKSNLCLKTKGDVKIQTGGKYITLVKDGKINVDPSGVFKSVESMDGVVKDGLYVVTNADGGSSIYAVIGRTQYMLSNSEDGYVSFTSVQSLTNTQMSQALSNIGLYFETRDAAVAAGITDGLIYITGENQLYRVVGGQWEAALTEFSASSGEAQGEEEVVQSCELELCSITISGENNSIHSEGSLFLEAAEDITLTSGSNCTEIDSNGIKLGRAIDINSNTITVTGTVSLQGLSTYPVKSSTATEGSRGLYIATDNDYGDKIQAEHVIIYNPHYVEEEGVIEGNEGDEEEEEDEGDEGDTGGDTGGDEPDDDEGGEEEEEEESRPYDYRVKPEYAVVGDISELYIRDYSIPPGIEEEEITDDDGNPVPDSDGNPTTQEVEDYDTQIIQFGVYATWLTGKRGILIENVTEEASNAGKDITLDEEETYDQRVVTVKDLKVFIKQYLDSNGYAPAT